MSDEPEYEPPPGPCMHGGCTYAAFDIVGEEVPDHPDFKGMEHACCCNHPTTTALRHKIEMAEQLHDTAMRKVGEALARDVPRYLDFMHEINPGPGVSWSNYTWALEGTPSFYASGYVTFSAFIYGDDETVSIPWAFFDDPEGWMTKEREERQSAKARAQRERDDEIRRQEIALLQDLMSRYPEEALREL